MKKTALIGATGTIGSAIAPLLKENGHDVLGVSRKGAYPMDMEDPQSIARFC